ncbi:MAG: adenosylcobinamide-GDP ribazoletransferase [Eubacteriales bacterium]|nr:adenosylcobinamide-GDP ribazoletransferase [Eubacteriales bacterium]
MNSIRGFWMALGMFSILPVPLSKIWDEQAKPWMMSALPLVGLFIGLITGLLQLLFTWLVVPIWLQAVLIVLIYQKLTGFIHLDGLMDTSDALGSQAQLEKRLAILKDPHVGSFAVLTLVFVLMIQVASVLTLSSNQLLSFNWAWQVAPWLLIPVVSRALVSLFVLHTKRVVTQGLAQSFRERTTAKQSILPISMLVIAFVGVASLAIWTGQAELLLILMMEILTGIVAFNCVHRAFSGISGDLAGYIVVISETAALLSWALLVGGLS